MADETYYAVVNDNPMCGGTEAVTFCRTDGGETHVYRGKEDALRARDALREEYTNPDINVYELAIHEGSLEWTEEESSDE